MLPRDLSDEEKSTRIKQIVEKYRTRLPKGKFNLTCPKCNAGWLMVDLESMQEEYGSDWERAPKEDFVYSCSNCEEAGLYGEFFAD